MTPESSPFSPGQPVPIEFFTGRIREVEQLRSMVKSSLMGRFKIGFVAGERGIGKSSLVSFIKHLAEREDNAAGCHIFLGGIKDLTETVRRIFDRLLKESIDKPWYGKVRGFFGRHVREVGLFGVSVELDLSPRDKEVIADDFVPSLRRLIVKLGEERKSILLILDDINGLAASEPFANWLKSVVDEIATSGQRFPVCLLIVGLEERRQELVSLQPSLARVFELIEIDPWSEEETYSFFRASFSSGGAHISDESLKQLVRFTGGLPVLAHEIGDAVWRASETADVSEVAVWTGIVNAAELIGRKFLKPQVFQALRSERYRSILRKMAHPSRLTFLRTELIEKLNPEERRVMDNFLRRMKYLGALLPDEQRGAYRFPNRLHALYFWIEAERAKREEKGQDKRIATS